jgi:hypothetical protein
LHQAGALIGEEVAFARGDRTLSIRARVDSDGRKATLQHALGPIALAGAQVRVETFAEAAARSRASAPGKIIFQDLGALADRAAASPLLAAYFAKQFGAETDPRVREASRAFSTRVLDAARQSTLHAFALKRIAGRFAAQDLERASDAARVTYQVLVREYAGVVESSARELTRDLESLFGGGTASTDSPAGAPSIEALATQAAELERAMDAAFAVQAGGSPAVAPDGERLLSLVRSLQRTAAAVREGSSQQVGR